MNDLISRQAAIDVIKAISNLDEKAKGGIISTLLLLDSAQPERKTGRWVKKSTEWRYECSECGSRPPKSEWVSGRYLSRYCPYCGARMENDL